MNCMHMRLDFAGAIPSVADELEVSIVVDVNCADCGKSGSLRVLPSDVKWRDEEDNDES